MYGNHQESRAVSVWVIDTSSGLTEAAVGLMQAMSNLLVQFYRQYNHNQYRNVDHGESKVTGSMMLISLQILLGLLSSLFNHSQSRLVKEFESRMYHCDLSEINLHLMFSVAANLNLNNSDKEF